jgi:hypothetical protein
MDQNLVEVDLAAFFAARVAVNFLPDVLLLASCWLSSRVLCLRKLLTYDLS